MLNKWIGFFCLVAKEIFCRVFFSLPHLIDRCWYKNKLSPFCVVLFFLSVCALLVSISTFAFIFYSEYTPYYGPRLFLSFSLSSSLSLSHSLFLPSRDHVEICVLHTTSGNKKRRTPNMGSKYVYCYRLQYYFFLFLPLIDPIYCCHEEVLTNNLVGILSYIFIRIIVVQL